jgi:hypothetical protein
MKIARVLLLAAIVALSFSACKKEEPAPVIPATTGTIKIVFEGTATPGNGNQVSLYFATDLYHLDQKIFSFSEISNAPHTEITITDVEPQDWYYMQLISTTGAPSETQGTVLVKAGETKTITVQLF